MLILGIDSGLTGALALIQPGVGLLECQDLPTGPSGNESGKLRKWLHAKSLDLMLRGWSANHRWATDFTACVIERPIPMPSMPSTTNASTFDSFGVIRAVCSLKCDEMHYVSPSEWKRQFGLGRDKEESRALALKLYPEAAGYLKTKSSHNRAEAVLLAHWLGRKLA